MPGDSPHYPTVIPNTTDLRLVDDDVDDVIATDHNDAIKEVIALALELGVLPKGSCADVKTRLDISLSDDGNLFPSGLYTTVPTYPTSAGKQGQRSHDGNYVYFCNGTDTWKRSALTTW